MDGECLEVFDEESQKWIAVSLSYQSSSQVLRVCFESGSIVSVLLLDASFGENNFQGRTIVLEVHHKETDLPIRFAFPSKSLLQVWKGLLKKAAESTTRFTYAGSLLWRAAGEEWRKSYAVVARSAFAAFTDSNMMTPLVAVSLVGCKVHVDDCVETKILSVEPCDGPQVQMQLSNLQEFEAWTTAIYGTVMDTSTSGKDSDLKCSEEPKKKTRSKNESYPVETVHMSGSLLKLGAKVKNWKKRLFTLHTNGNLTYSVDKFGVTEVLGEISLHGTTVKPLSASEYEGRQYLFGIFPAGGGRVYVLQASSQAEEDRWMIAMNSYRDKYTPTSEDCVFEGYMRKLGEVVPTWKERYFRLYSTNPRLEYFKNERERRRLGVVCLARKCRVQIEPDREDMTTVYSLFATEECRNYLLACSSTQDRKLWIAHIQSVWSGGGSGPVPAPLSNFASEEEMSNETEFQSGWFMKLGEVRKSWKKRWFVLFMRARKLKYYVKAEDKKATGEIPLLRGATVTYLDPPASLNKEYCFTITPVDLRRTYTLQAASEEERESWVTMINKVALQGAASLHTLTKSQP